MTVFLLIRHATYAALGHTLTGRMAGLHLAAAGHAEARTLAERLAHLPICAVASSPLERAHETAQPLANQFGLDVIPDVNLAEIDFGDWSGQTFAKLQADTTWQHWNSFRSGTGTPGGETMLQAQARIVGALAHWQRAYPHGLVALVSHSDLIKAALAYFLGMPLDLMQRLEIWPASVSVLKLEDHGPQVILLNHCGIVHLP